jgi:hypothetical protein
VAAKVKTDGELDINRILFMNGLVAIDALPSLLHKQHPRRKLAFYKTLVEDLWNSGRIKVVSVTHGDNFSTKFAVDRGAKLEL